MGLVLTSAAVIDSTYYEQKKRAEQLAGKSLSNKEFEEQYYEPAYHNGGLSDTGTSVFSPVLCEMNYLWFTASGDTVLDPFAGGSVRGVVAERLGRKYTGIELRPEQVNANIEQGETICDICPEWIQGDSLRMNDLLGSRSFDHIFTCPPYGNLEVYSDDPADISNMASTDFDAVYSEIMGLACSHLKEDRFATVVVGNYRDAGGFLRDLCALTVSAMQDAGLRYYNDLIYVTPAGALPIRTARVFKASRKVGKTHQYILNFVKGDPKIATERLGDVLLPKVLEED